jgi:hypothetical protein
MRRDPEASQPMDVLEHIARVACQAIRRLRQSERNQMAVRGADLDAVDEQHAVHVARRIGRARRVAVVGEHHEVEAGAMRGTGNPLGRSGAVGPHGVHVNRAAAISGSGAVRAVSSGGSRSQRIVTTATATERPDHRARVMLRARMESIVDARRRASSTCV